MIQWPGSSPDLNVAENVGAILKDKTEEELAKRSPTDRLGTSALLEVIQNVLHEMENDSELFQRLLRTYPRRLAAVKKAEGYATEY